VQSRSITHENPTGAPGVGGRAASSLGPGRKGAPATMIAPGQTLTIAEIDGPGVIRHLWFATYFVPEAMRGLTLRIYWEGQSHPSVEAPLGDFCGFAHGHSPPFSSVFHSVGEKGALNCWMPMPFAAHARITISNEMPIEALLFYQVDFTQGDALRPGFGRLHAHFRRELSTRTRDDFVVLPQRRGSGRYLGAVFGVRPLGPSWWGEGEFKVYLDEDREFPTIVGTGSEDYVGLAWCVQQTPFPYHGASLVMKSDLPNMAGPVSMYRWHVADPIYWRTGARAVIQQIGVVITPETAPRSFEQYLSCLREREDDWSCCAFWYEPTPSAPLPPYADLETRYAGLPRTPNLRALPLQPEFTTQTELQ
jgi:hypothetical protein